MIANEDASKKLMNLHMESKNLSVMKPANLRHSHEARVAQTQDDKDPVSTSRPKRCPTF